MAKTRQKKEKDVLDQLLDNIDFRGLTQDEVVGKGGLIKQLTGRILQRALEAEMTEHLGYEKNSNSGDNSGNSRNGHTEKTVLMENQSATISVPRDRAGTFEPIIVPKHEKRVQIHYRIGCVQGPVLSLSYFLCKCQVSLERHPFLSKLNGELV